MNKASEIKCDLCVIGTGTTGMAAALCAANRGLTTVQVGQAGEILFASGLLDLMGVYPIAKKKIWRDPWAGITALNRDLSMHPYTRLEKENIRKALDEFLAFLNSAGVVYKRHLNRNSEVVTALGTTKLTYAVPLPMWQGVKALKNKSACLLIDIRGLKGFSARQIAQTLATKWPDMRTARVEFPDSAAFSEVYAERLARSLESPQTRKQFAKTLQPLLNGAQIVGLPAILGISKSTEVMSDLERLLGVPIFEIPTMPPSPSGLRLKEAFERHLPSHGVRLFSQHRVRHVQTKANRRFAAEIGDSCAEGLVRPRGIILATGRFIGRGLQADRHEIRETLFNLPVHQPAERAQWHNKEFLDPAGHPINRAGLEIDDRFRPLNKRGKPVHKMLFAAGSILAHQDWMRMKCGSGLAIATAYGAVMSFISLSKYKAPLLAGK